MKFIMQETSCKHTDRSLGLHMMPCIIFTNWHMIWMSSFFKLLLSRPCCDMWSEANAKKNQSSTSIVLDKIIPSAAFLWHYLSVGWLLCVGTFISFQSCLQYFMYMITVLMLKWWKLLSASYQVLFKGVQGFQWLQMMRKDLYKLLTKFCIMYGDFIAGIMLSMPQNYGQEDMELLQVKNQCISYLRELFHQESRQGYNSHLEEVKVFSKYSTFTNPSSFNYSYTFATY